MADYPISNIPRRIVYTGSAGVGPYAFPFEVLLATDINVYKNDVLLTITADYTVTISPTLGTGSVTLVVAASGSDRITIVGARAVERTTDFTTGGDFFANTVNSELDSQTILTQQVAETAERSIKAPVTDPTNINMTLPINTSRAGKTLAFDADGNPIVGDPIGNWRGDWAAGVSYQNRDLAKDTTTDNVYIVKVPHISSGSLPITTNVDSAKWDLVIDAEAAGTARIAAEAAEAAALVSANNAASSASAASTSATNAATSASTATTQATNASNSASSASSSALAAQVSRSNALVSENNAASSASAASTSATNAANSASSASSSASTATTQATNASNSASSASTSATTATTQAGIATTQASNASTSASNAATSETNAANSATSASTSATNASNSATSAAGSAAVAESIAESLVLEFKPLVKPTLDLNFANNDYTIYDSFANSYTDKPYADMLTVTNGAATGFDAIGVLRDSVANNIRLVFDPVTGVSQGALVEPAATNLLLYSEQFDNAWWIKTSVTVTADSDIAPDGTQTADKLVETATTSQSRWNTQTITASGTVFTLSIYVKPDPDRLGVTLYPNIGGNGCICDFNLSTLTVVPTNVGTATGTGTITNVGNGWYRLALTVTFAVSITSLSNFMYFSNNAADGNASYTGNGSSGIHVWGAQLETGSVPTSYIKTEASTVTRVADEITRTLGDEFNPNEFTLFVDVEKGANPIALVTVGNGAGNRVGLFSATIVQIVLNTTVVINTAIATIANGGKVAVVYKKGDYRVYVNGALVSSSTNTTANPSGALDTLNISRRDWAAIDANYINNKSQLYPRALSEAECIALTTLGA